MPALGTLADSVRYSLGGIACGPSCAWRPERPQAESSTGCCLPRPRSSSSTRSPSSTMIPALDDDEERRGQPSVWAVYGEATAIWPVTRSSGRRRLALTAGPEVVRELVEATLGMIGGQQMDMEGGHDLAELHRLKTGGLFSASIMCGVWAAGIPGAEHGPWRAFAEELGLLFQVVDDILDGDGYVVEVGEEGGRASWTTRLPPGRSRGSRRSRPTPRCSPRWLRGSRRARRDPQAGRVWPRASELRFEAERARASVRLGFGRGSRRVARRGGTRVPPRRCEVKPYGTGSCSSRTATARPASGTGSSTAASARSRRAATTRSRPSECWRPGRRRAPRSARRPRDGRGPARADGLACAGCRPRRDTRGGVRLDVLLVERGLAESRAQAQALVRRASCRAREAGRAGGRGGAAGGREPAAVCVAGRHQAGQRARRVRRRSGRARLPGRRCFDRWLHRRAASAGRAARDRPRRRPRPA